MGVFLAFTLSQAGMVLHWVRLRGAGWWVNAAINGLGALATLITLVVVAYSKFLEGAWIVIVLIPLLVVAFRVVKDHYREIALELSLSGMVPQSAPPRAAASCRSPACIAAIEALYYARSISDR